MSLTNLAYTAAVLPLLEKQKYAGLGRSLKAGQRLEELSLEDNLAMQWPRVQETLRLAYDSVPFYKRRFDDAGMSLSEIVDPCDLSKIPALTREDIRKNYNDLWSRRFRRESLLEAATGGTTDTPVPILRDPGCIRARNAVQIQLLAWAGIRPGDKVFWLWGARSDFAENPGWRWKFYDRYILRRQWAPTSLLNEQVLSDYARRLNAFRPTAIIAYPAPLTAFCEYLLASNYRGYLPKTAVCTAEPLLDEQRKVIERALQCRVFMHYGTRDFGLVAAECEMHSGLHVHPSAVLVETIPMSGADDGLREILVTDLLNPAFPLIRYKINDCVHPQDPLCACGRGFPLISHIEGRVTDNFYLPNGDLVPGVAFTNRIIKTASGIKKLQVIQNESDRFQVNYVPGPDFIPTSLDNLKGKLVEFLGSGIHFEFTQVEEILREKSGKTRLCISKVKPAQFAESSDPGGQR